MSAAVAVQALTDLAKECRADFEADPNLHDNPDALAVVLQAIRQARADLARLYADMETELLAVAGERRWVVDGFGEVGIRKKKNRTAWDNDDLTRKLVALALDERVLDEKSGEFEPAHEAVARVLSLCSRPSWRLTPLRARGIDVSEYCHEEDAGYAVELPPLKGED